MAKLFMRTLTWLLLGLVGSAVYANSLVQQPSVAFYYGNEPPVELLSQFDWIVVEAANVDSTEQRLLAQHGGQPFAYVSIGELDAWRGLPPRCPLMHSSLLTPPGIAKWPISPTRRGVLT